MQVAPIQLFPIKYNAYNQKAISGKQMANNPENKVRNCDGRVFD